MNIHHELIVSTSHYQSEVSRPVSIHWSSPISNAYGAVVILYIKEEGTGPSDTLMNSCHSQYKCLHSSQPLVALPKARFHLRHPDPPLYISNLWSGACFKHWCPIQILDLRLITEPLLQSCLIFSLCESNMAARDNALGKGPVDLK